MIEIRSDAWLSERIDLLWKVHFSDVPRGYPIVTRFGSRARYRFGSIATRKGCAVILVNRLFSDSFVPTYVVDGTLVHELAHYAHGFGSGLPRLHEHAHRGGVVERELETRGLVELMRRADAWRDANWEAFYARECDDLSSRRMERQQGDTARWRAFLCREGARSEAELAQWLLLLAPRFGYTPAQLPFRVVWLLATPRQNGLSYLYSRCGEVRVHALASHPRLPIAVLQYEIAYWLARGKVGSRWQAIEEAIRAAGMGPVLEEAVRWRRCAWARFRTRHHPLLADAHI